MDLRFTQDGVFAAQKKSEEGVVMPLSKAADVKSSEFDSIIQIIDESGNELNCTLGKFIEIFDNLGLEGFIL